jgi:hypothetical protein
VQIQSAAGKAVQFTELPGFADGAAYTTGTVSLSGQSIGVSGFYFLKGVNFVGFRDPCVRPRGTDGGGLAGGGNGDPGQAAITGR